MRNFLAAVLSVIAVGVLLIAYGLLSPRASAADLYPSARPMLASERLGGIEDLTPRQAAAYRVSDLRAVPAAYDTYRTPARVSQVRTTRSTPVRVERRSNRDWTKTMMTIGGTTAAGAGLGAIFGGKKGALIGAALGGGAGTLFEVQKR
jgi:hypothetical protein